MRCGTGSFLTGCVFFALFSTREVRGELLEE